MNKVLPLFFFLIICCNLLSAFSGHGLGTSNDPYEITNCYELQEVNNSLSSYYRVVNDIDCSVTSTWDSEKGFFPIGTGSATDSFNGTFDGNGYEISNLYINRTSRSDVGLFRQIAWRGIVKNVGLVDFNFSGSHNTASITGTNYGEIKYSYSIGYVSVPKGNDGAGFVGVSYGNISDSYAIVNVSCGTAYSRCSGFVATGGTVNRSYFAGNVTKPVPPTNDANSFSFNSDTNSSFYDSNRSTISPSGDATAKSTIQLFDIKTYNDTSTSGLSHRWDIAMWDTHTDEVWKINNGSGYPQLYYESAPSQLYQSEIEVPQGGGGGLSEILYDWNPTVFPELEEALKIFFSASDIETLPKKTWDVFRLFLAFIFRQPAYLGKQPLEGGV